AEAGRASPSSSATVQAGRAGADRRTDRALSRLAAVAGLHGIDLSTGNRAGGALAEGASGRQRRCGLEGCRERNLGREREIADRVSRRADDDEREARLDAEARRRLSRATEGRDGCRA